MQGKRFNCTLPVDVYNELEMSAKQMKISKSKLVTRRLTSRTPEVLNLGDVASELYKLKCYLNFNGASASEDLRAIVQKTLQLLDKYVSKNRSKN